MDFDFNDEQREIKSTAHEFLASRFKPEKVRELAESDSPYDDALWKEICELGWPGIAIAEEHGGQGLGVVELVILAGGARLRAARRRPLISNAYAGALHRGAPARTSRSAAWLPGIASGEAARRRRVHAATRSRSSAPPAGAVGPRRSATATGARARRARRRRRSSAST